MHFNIQQNHSKTTQNIYSFVKLNIKIAQIHTLHDIIS